MRKPIGIGLPQRINLGRIPAELGFYLPTAAAIISCMLCLFLQMPIEVERPLILLLGSLFALVPLRPSGAVLIQKMMLFYLACIPVNELAGHYFQLLPLKTNIKLSYSVLIVLLYGGGYFSRRLHYADSSARGWTDMAQYWLFLFVVVLGHILWLTGLLYWFYGYGYEHNIAVLGNLSLYFLLFIFLWDGFDAPGLRRIIALVLTIFYAILPAL